MRKVNAAMRYDLAVRGKAVSQADALIPQHGRETVSAIRLS
jgi:hypothetical protein